MSIVEFKEACKAHRALCPYKSTGFKTCGANVKLDDQGKCPKGEQECWYMGKFKEKLREVGRDER